MTLRSYLAAEFRKGYARGRGAKGLSIKDHLQALVAEQLISWALLINPDSNDNIALIKCIMPWLKSRITSNE